MYILGLNKQRPFFFAFVYRCVKAFVIFIFYQTIYLQSVCDRKGYMIKASLKNVIPLLFIRFHK